MRASFAANKETNAFIAIIQPPWWVSSKFII